MDPKKLLGLALQEVRDSTALGDRLLGQAEVNREGYTWLRTINSKGPSTLRLRRIFQIERNFSWALGLYMI